MTDMTLNLDLRNVEASNGVQIIPAAWYKLMIDESSVELTKSSKDAGNDNNKLLKIRMSVMEGPFVNRKVFKTYNIKNDNAVAQEIAHKELKALTEAVGHPGILQSSAELHGIPFMGKVKVRAERDGYEASNDVSSVLHLSKPLPANAVVSGAGTTGGAPSVPSGPPGFAGSAPAPTAPPAAAPSAPNFAAPAPAVASAPVAPQVPVVPSAPVAPPAPAHDPVKAALADGWAIHPQNPEYYWKGSDVVKASDMAAMYPAPVVAAPAAPVAPAVPTAPAAPSVPAAPAPAPVAAPAPAAGTAVIPPWMQSAAG